MAFVADCAAGGVEAVSFGGGEPLEFTGLFDLLRCLRGHLFRSITTNGLSLDDAMTDRLADAAVDKVHVSVHFPDRWAEVERVIRQVTRLGERGIRSGINLLVARSKLPAAAEAARRIRGAGIDSARIVYLPMRGQDTPTPRELAAVAGDRPFQSMSCLGNCAPSDRFCAVRGGTARWPGAPTRASAARCPRSPTPACSRHSTPWGFVSAGEPND